MIDIIAQKRDQIDSVRGQLEKEKILKREILGIWGGAGGGKAIQGVYVPEHFEIKRDDRGRIEAIGNIAGGPDVIDKALVTDLGHTRWISEPPIPHIQGVANRISVEPIRGCTHGCRFCNGISSVSREDGRSVERTG
jgi:radical SAM superfamily enzyme YgiQ (UPF0313 family)